MRFGRFCELAIEAQRIDKAAPQHVAVAIGGEPETCDTRDASEIAALELENDQFLAHRDE